jgi:hypothetical protein
MPLADRTEQTEQESYAFKKIFVSLKISSEHKKYIKERPPNILCSLKHHLFTEFPEHHVVLALCAWALGV